MEEYPSIPSSQVVEPEWRQIQSKAETFAFLAGVLFVIFIFCMIGTFLSQIFVVGYIGAAALAASLWVYQSAQLLHIRALLARAATPPLVDKSPVG